MDKIDVLKIIRANDEKFKKHIEKIHQLEEREKKLNLNDLIKQNENLKKKQAELLNSNNKEKDNDYPYNLPLQTFHSISSASEESPKKNNKEEKKNYVMEQICDTDENEENNNEKCKDEKSDDNVLEYSKDEEDNDIQGDSNKNNPNENKIRSFINKLNNQLNIDTPFPKEEQKKKEKQKPTTKNLDKVLSHYYQSDSEENENENENCNNKQQLNENYLNPPLPEINSLSLGDSDKPDLMTPNFNQSPIHSTRITQLNPRKFSTVAKENINQAVLDNINKKKYTAYTYSTIQKKKNTEKPKKSKIFINFYLKIYRTKCF